MSGLNLYACVMHVPLLSLGCVSNRRLQVMEGKQTPLFFGSAMNNFGVELFLKKFLAISGPPSPRETNVRSRHRGGYYYSKHRVMGTTTPD